MKLITGFELSARSIPELHVLYRDIFNALVMSAPDSAERRNALASLENIQTEIARKNCGPKI